MKAISPVRSLRKGGAGAPEPGLGISRSKTPADDPLSLLYNMNDCYSKLKELVPSIPQNKNVSKMEILQHVIDYILDLQIALDSHSAMSSLRPGHGTVRSPLTTLNTDISILSLQVTEAASGQLLEASNRLERVEEISSRYAGVSVRFDHRGQQDTVPLIRKADLQNEGL
ncbi:hypothetical protein NFI96_033126 [Prochilodus magdalenae]|nr:hypothetical protein NFI96_033126 [Prochilodus magdalenae]